MTNEEAAFAAKAAKLNAILEKLDILAIHFEATTSNFDFKELEGQVDQLWSEYREIMVEGAQVPKPEN